MILEILLEDLLGVNPKSSSFTDVESPLPKSQFTHVYSSGNS